MTKKAGLRCQFKAGFLCFLLFLVILWFVTLGIHAQTFQDDEVIDITGLNYGRLQIFIDVDESLTVKRQVRKQVMDLVEKNLLWSGYFDVREEFDLWDIKLAMSLKDQNRLIARILSTEDVVLFEESAELPGRDEEINSAILDLVSKIVHQLTGEKSIFKSAIIFVKRDAKKRYQLVLADPFWENETVILDDGKINILPRWNPDGESILYTSLGRRGSRIKQLNLNTGKTKVLFEGMGKLSGGTWGPDGNELVITVSKKGNTDLFRINTKGEILEQITFRSTSESNPRWSPDGKSLLYVSNRSGGVQIYQRNMESKETFRMTFEGGYNVEPCWSDDGNSIVHAGLDEGKYFLYIMDRDGIYSQKINKDDKSAQQPIWAPNGRQILYVAVMSGDQKLFLIRSDGTYKRRLTNSKKGISEFNPTWIGAYKWRN